MSLKEYLLSLLGESEFQRLNSALQAGKAVVVSGRYVSGKTTLVDVLRKNGYQAVEDFETCQVILEKPLTSMTPNFADKINSSAPGTSEKC